MVLSANVHCLHTNIGDLTHNFVLHHSVDVVLTMETWLDEDVEPIFGKMHGYSHWVRKDLVEVLLPASGKKYRSKHSLWRHCLRWNAFSSRW